MTERWSTTLTRAALGAVLTAAVILLILTCLGFRPGQIVEMFSHPVTGGTRTVAAEAPKAPDGQTVLRGFGTLNYTVLAAYLVGMIAIGFVVGRRVKGTRGYFTADGRVNYIIVGLSLLGTYLSALTMMALSGWSYGEHNWVFMVQLPFLIITAAVITRFVLPRYREAGVISVYEYLERRIHVSARLLASASFVIFSVARSGLVLYLPALALSTVTGISLPLCIVVMGVIITLYTVIGGIEAVIWTDAVQVAVIVLGAFLTLGCIFSAVGVDRFLEVGLAHNKFRYIVPSASIAKLTTLWAVLETIFSTIRIYGTQQDMTQRYMTTASTEKANRSVWISIIAYIPLGFFFYFIGTALFVFYREHPVAHLPKPDTMYPFFIVDRLPAGVAGLVIAAIFAAAMSSIDSLMNSSSTVCVEDFYKRLSRRKPSDASCLSLARWLTVLWGVLAVVMGLMFMEVTYAQAVWQKIMGISTNGVLGLMALAFLPFRVNWRAALAGFAVSYVCLFLMMSAGTDFGIVPLIGGTLTRAAAQLPSTHFLLYTIVGNTVCFGVALAAHALLARRELPQPA